MSLPFVVNGTNPQPPPSPWAFIAFIARIGMAMASKGWARECASDSRGARGWWSPNGCGPERPLMTCLVFDMHVHQETAWPRVGRLVHFPFFQEVVTQVQLFRCYDRLRLGPTPAMCRNMRSEHQRCLARPHQEHPQRPSWWHHRVNGRLDQ